MNRISILTLCLVFILTNGFSQSKLMTPEQLIELNRVSAKGLTKDGKQVIYKSSTFDLKTNKNTSINGNIQFKNLLNVTTDNFEMDGRFNNISSTYGDLKALLPRVLGNSIPSSMNALGRFDMQGVVGISNESIKTVMDIETQIGTLFVDLILDEVAAIDNASYMGEIQLTDFDLGYLIEESKIGLATARLSVEGRGFNRETINSNISGIFDSFAFQDYTYKDLEVLGVVENKIFTLNIFPRRGYI